MAKLNSVDLSNRINDLEIDDEIKMSLIEDITDSISNEESEELKSLRDELEQAKKKYDDLKNRYKERFLNAVESEEKEPEEIEEISEEEVIDIKEI